MGPDGRSASAGGSAAAFPGGRAASKRGSSTRSKNARLPLYSMRTEPNDSRMCTSGTIGPPSWAKRRAVPPRRRNRTRGRSPGVPSIPDSRQAGAGRPLETDDIKACRGVTIAPGRASRQRSGRRFRPRGRESRLSAGLGTPPQPVSRRGLAADEVRCSEIRKACNSPPAGRWSLAQGSSTGISEPDAYAPLAGDRLEETPIGPSGSFWTT